MVDMAKAFSYIKNFQNKPDQNMAWNQSSIQHFRGMHTLAREAMQSNLFVSLVNRRLLSKERPYSMGNIFFLFRVDLFQK